MKEENIGSSLTEFLEAEGIREEVEEIAMHRVVAWQISQAMKTQGISKVEMAKRMGTSRPHLDRILNPDNEKVQLDTYAKAAKAVGKKIRFELVD